MKQRITKVSEQGKLAQLLPVLIMSLYQLKVESFGLLSTEEVPPPPKKNFSLLTGDPDISYPLY